MTLPKHVYAVRDRHGKIRYRFRKRGLAQRYLPHPDVEGFAEAYEKCFDPDYAPNRVVRKTRVRTSVRKSLLPYKGQSLVYFISMRSSIKIGTTVNLHARLKKLQTGCPMRLKVLACVEGGAELEAQLHERFADLRMEGEWFRRSPALMNEIKRLKRAAMFPTEILATASNPIRRKKADINQSLA